jgi:hypothetical protein
VLNRWAKNNNFCVKNNSVSPIDYQITTIQSKSERKSMKKMIVEVCAGCSLRAAEIDKRFFFFQKKIKNVRHNIITIPTLIKN